MLFLREEDQQTTTRLFVEKSNLSKRQEGAARVGAMKGTSSTVKLAEADGVELALISFGFSFNTWVYLRK